MSLLDSIKRKWGTHTQCNLSIIDYIVSLALIVPRVSFLNPSVVSLSLYTLSSFLIGFCPLCVCVCLFFSLSLVCVCFGDGDVWIYRRRDRRPLPVHPLVYTNISCAGTWQNKFQWRVRRRRWPNVKPVWGRCKPFPSSIRRVYAENRPSIPTATHFETRSSIIRAWWPHKKVSYRISSYYNIILSIIKSELKFNQIPYV